MTDTIHPLALADETVTLPGCWAATRTRVDRPAQLPVTPLAEVLRAGLGGAAAEGEPLVKAKALSSSATAGTHSVHNITNLHP